MGTANVHRALERLTRLLEESEIPYAILGAMALNEYGIRRVTEDVDVLFSRQGLAEFKRRFLGRGYVDKFEGSKGFRDTENDVPIDVLLAGDYPGDGKPKAIAFPDPALEARRGERVRLLSLERLIELKLASGMSAPHRLRDFADVLDLIRSCHLDAAFEERIHESVRPRFRELWRAAQAIPREE